MAKVLTGVEVIKGHKLPTLRQSGKKGKGAYAETLAARAQFNQELFGIDERPHQRGGNIFPRGYVPSEHINPTYSGLDKQSIRNLSDDALVSMDTNGLDIVYGNALRKLVKNEIQRRQNDKKRKTYADVDESPKPRGRKPKLQKLKEALEKAQKEYDAIPGDHRKKPARDKKKEIEDLKKQIDEEENPKQKDPVRQERAKKAWDTRRRHQKEKEDKDKEQPPQEVPEQPKEVPEERPRPDIIAEKYPEPDTEEKILQDELDLEREIEDMLPPEPDRKRQKEEAELAGQKIDEDYIPTDVVDRIKQKSEIIDIIWWIIETCNMNIIQRSGSDVPDENDAHEQWWNSARGRKTFEGMSPVKHIYLTIKRATDIMAKMKTIEIMLKNDEIEDISGLFRLIIELYKLMKSYVRGNRFISSEDFVIVYDFFLGQDYALSQLAATPSGAKEQGTVINSINRQLITEVDTARMQSKGTVDNALIGKGKGITGIVRTKDTEELLNINGKSGTQGMTPAEITAMQNGFKGIKKGK